MFNHTKAMAAVTDAIRGTAMDDPDIAEIGRKPHMLIVGIDLPITRSPDEVGEAMAKVATALTRGGYYLHNLDMIPDAYAVDPAIILLDVRALVGLAPDLGGPTVQDFIQQFSAQLQPVVTEENIAKLRADGFDDLADALLKGWDRITRMHSRAAVAGILSEVSWPVQRMVEKVRDSIDNEYELAVEAGGTGLAALDALYEDKEGSDRPQCRKGHPLGLEIFRLMQEITMAKPDADPATSNRLLGEAIRAHPNGALLLDYLHRVGEGWMGDDALFLQQVLAAAAQ